MSRPARVITRQDGASLDEFMWNHIAPQSYLTTGQRTSDDPLNKDFEIQDGWNFPEMYRVILKLKGWLRGIYHYVLDLQTFLEETAIDSTVVS